jgi:hypothetical protein
MIAQQKACDLEIKNRELEYQLAKKRQQYPKQAVPKTTRWKADIIINILKLQSSPGYPSYSEVFGSTSFWHSQ